MFNKLIVLILLALPAFSAVLDVCLSGCTYNVANADDSNPIQMAMNAATCGDRIEITEGETHPVSIVMPLKSCAGNPITVTTRRWRELPAPGVRVNPTQHAHLMPTLEPLYSTNIMISAGQTQRTISSLDTSTDTITFTGAHGMVDGDPVSCRSYQVASPGLPTGLTQNVRYYVRGSTATTMQYALIPGGAAIDLSGSLSGPANHCTKAIGTSGWVFEGLNLTTKADAVYHTHMMQFGSGEESSYEGLPHHLTVRHNLIHGRQTQTNGPRDLLQFQDAQFFEASDNWLSDAKYESTEVHGVYLGTASRYGIIRNNYISAASMCIFSGGTSGSIANAMPEFLVIEGNHCNLEGYMHRRTGAGAPPSEDCFYDTFSAIGAFYLNTTGSPTDCAGGNCYRCKSSRAWVQDTSSPFHLYVLNKGRIEFKRLRNSRVSRNIIRNGVVSGDTGNPGTCAMFPSQVDLDQPWTNGENIKFSDNICDTTWRFVQTASYGASTFTVQNKNVIVSNNLAYNIGKFPAMSIHTDATASYNLAYMVTDGCEGCVFEKNTVIEAPDTTATAYTLMIDTPADGYTISGFKFQNNILSRMNNATYVGGYGGGGGCAQLGPYFTSLTPTVFNNYVLIGSGDNPLSTCSTNAAVESSIAFEADYSLTPASKYSASCVSSCGFTSTDGTDLGADVKQIYWETSGALSGTPRWLEQGWSVDAGSTAALIAYTAPSSAACDVKIYTDAGRTTLHADTSDAGEQTDARAGSYSSGIRRIFRIGTNTALTASTRYYGTVACGTQLRPFQLNTKAAGAGRSVPVSYATARTGEYSASPDFSSPTAISSAAKHVVPVSANSVVWYRETNGIVRAFVAP